MKLFDDTIFFSRKIFCDVYASRSGTFYQKNIYFINDIQSITTSNLIQIGVLFFSLTIGSCEHGTILCGGENDGDDFKCLPHHLVCGQMNTCREKYKVVCGLFYGHVEYIKNLTSALDTKLTPDVLNTNDSSSCGK